MNMRLCITEMFQPERLQTDELWSGINVNKVVWRIIDVVVRRMHVNEKRQLFS